MRHSIRTHSALSSRHWPTRLVLAHERARSAGQAGTGCCAVGVGATRAGRAACAPRRRVEGPRRARDATGGLPKARVALEGAAARGVQTDPPARKRRVVREPCAVEARAVGGRRAGLAVLANTALAGVQRALHALSSRLIEAAVAGPLAGVVRVEGGVGWQGHDGRAVDAGVIRRAGAADGLPLS